MTISLSSPNSSTASIQKNGGDVITFDANNNATFAGNLVTTGTVVSGSAMGMRNRIINGDMRIWQRGTTFTSGYTADRWPWEASGTMAVTLEKSTDVPTGQGFSNSLKITTTTADSSIDSNDYAQLCQYIEGYTVADFMYGTAAAQTTTWSFWVKASQTGVYSFHLTNDGTICYASYFTVATANTWTKYTITVPGPTTGTWGTTNGHGLDCRIGFAYGTYYAGATGNTWATYSGFVDSFYTPTNNMMSTVGATFYITGVQLEVGSVATPFERRLYGQELALCQRYFQVIISGTGYFSNASAQTSTNAWGVYTLGTSMRANPTGYVVSGTNYYRFIAHDLDDFVDSVYVNGQSPNVVAIGNSTQISNTQGRPGVYTAVNAAALVAAQAEL